MSDQPIKAGDQIIAIVTKTVPFGVLVEFAGVPGLVHGATGEPGEALALRVVEYDVAERRFSATAA